MQQCFAKLIRFNNEDILTTTVRGYAHEIADRKFLDPFTSSPRQTLYARPRHP